MRLYATDHHLLVLAIQLVFNSSHCLLILLIFYQLLYEDIVGQSAEGLTGHVDSLPLIYQASHFISLVKYDFFLCVFIYAVYRLVVPETCDRHRK